VQEAEAKWDLMSQSEEEELEASKAALIATRTEKVGTEITGPEKWSNR